MNTFRLEEGFRIEVVAAEPLVMDPVAMDIDEHGRIFVAEMPGYPLDVSGTGRIKLLRDTDGDGQPDDASVFADGLRLPTGVLRWKNGILVTDAPDVVFLADTTEDGIADVREVVLTGFALSNAQHNANKPVYGLDNWIYIANNAPISWTEKYADPFGDRGSAIHYPKYPASPRLPRNGADRNIRFHPDRVALESLSSRSQFGQTFDAWGRHFLVNNSRHHLHEVIPARLFGAQDYATLADTRHSTPDHGDAAEVFPITVRPEHQLLTDRGVFTSACGLTYYLGGLFPAPYDRGVTFVAEPVHNLVHADRVVPDGPTFTAQRMHEGREFLASTDSWFRPVNFSHGPDGALYVVDYYRQIVEHPEWMDDSLAAHADLTRGYRMGRLYRIVPDGTPPLDWYGNIDFGNTDSLVHHLASPNAWWRRTAQRLLVDRRDPRAAALLADLFFSSHVPVARLHALWALEGLAALPEDIIRTALQDEHAGIRENAVKLAADHPGLYEDLLPLGRDPDARVRFEVMGALRGVNSSEARETQYAILWRDLQSTWVQSAALLAMDEPPAAFLRRAMREPGLSADVRSSFVERISTVLGRTGTPDDLLHVMQSTQAYAPVLRGIAQGLRLRGGTLPDLRALRHSLVLRALGDGNDAAASAAVDVLAQVGLPPGTAASAHAEAVLKDTVLPAVRRIRAVRILELGDAHGALLARVATSSDSFSVRRQALISLRRVSGEAPSRAVLDAWPSLTPALRSEALAVFNSDARAAMLVAAIQEGRVLPSEIPWQIRVRLMRDTREPVRSLARSLLQLPEPATTGDVPRQPGTPARGRSVFLALCAQCHRAGKNGTGQMGPDLATVRHWPRSALYDKVKDPNRSVASGYEQWVVTRSDGVRLQGVVTSETPATITLAVPQELYTIARMDIASMTAVAASAMPPGLLDGLQEEEIADLLSFLSSL